MSLSRQHSIYCTIAHLQYKSYKTSSERFVLFSVALPTGIKRHSEGGERVQESSKQPPAEPFSSSINVVWFFFFSFLANNAKTSRQEPGRARCLPPLDLAAAALQLLPKYMVSRAPAPESG